jgi:hypothetical protein
MYFREITDEKIEDELEGRKVQTEHTKFMLRMVRMKTNRVTYKSQVVSSRTIGSSHC